MTITAIIAVEPVPSTGFSDASRQACEIATRVGRPVILRIAGRNEMLVHPNMSPNEVTDDYFGSFNPDKPESSAVECARRIGVPIDTLTGQRRNQSAVAARRAVASELRAAGLTLEEIGLQLGGRNHSTIINLLHTPDGLTPSAGEAVCSNCDRIDEVGGGKRLSVGEYLCRWCAKEYALAGRAS